MATQEQEETKAENKRVVRACLGSAVVGKHEGSSHRCEGVCSRVEFSLDDDKIRDVWFSQLLEPSRIFICISDNRGKPRGPRVEIHEDHVTVHTRRAFVLHVVTVLLPEDQET